MEPTLYSRDQTVDVRLRLRIMIRVSFSVTVSVNVSMRLRDIGRIVVRRLGSGPGSVLGWKVW